MAAVSTQLQIPTRWLNHNGVQMYTDTNNNSVVTIAGSASLTLQGRFAIPRSIIANMGAQLNSVALSYQVVSGTLASVTPTLARIVNANTAAPVSTAMPLNVASPAAALIAGYCRTASAVTTPAYETTGATSTASFNLTYTFVAAAAGASIVIHGMEALYSAALIAGNLNGTTSAALNASGTITRAMIYGGIVTSTTGAAVVGTTDSATNIISGLDNPQVGDTWRFKIINTGGLNTFTVAAGPSVTIVGNAVIAASTSRECVMQVTNVGTPAVTIYM